MAKRARRAPAEAFSYVPKEDRELTPAEQSTFRFRPLTQAERLAALDAAEIVYVDATGARTVQQRSFSQARELVLLTLQSAENFPAGEPVPYPATATLAERSRYLELLDDALMYELGNTVFDRSTLGEAEKNSSTPSPTPN